MNLLRKYYDKDSIGGGIPDEDNNDLSNQLTPYRVPSNFSPEIYSKAEDLYEMKQISFDWLGQTASHQKDLIIYMMTEFAIEQIKNNNMNIEKLFTEFEKNGINLTAFATDGTSSEKLVADGVAGLLNNTSEEISRLKAENERLIKEVKRLKDENDDLHFSGTPLIN